MKGNKGFGRFEVLTLVVVLLAIAAYFMYSIVGGVSSNKLDTMKKSALVFSNSVSANRASFVNENEVYLKEVLDQGLLKKIRSPFSPGYCDAKESKVEIANSKVLVTLKCDEYLIEKTNTQEMKKVKVYKVSEWKKEKPKKNVEERQFYNCVDAGNKEMFENYEEEGMMLYNVNRENGGSYTSVADITNICKPVNKTLFRTKVLVK